MFRNAYRATAWFVVGVLWALVAFGLVMAVSLAIQDDVPAGSLWLLPLTVCGGAALAATGQLRATRGKRDPG